MVQKKKKQLNNKPSSEWKNNEETEKHQRYPDVYSIEHLGKLKSILLNDEGVFEITTEYGFKIHIELWRNDIFRVRYLKPHEAIPSHSYALRPDIKRQSCDFDLEEKEESITIKTPNIQCRVYRSDCSIEYLNSSNKEPILKEATPFVRRSSILEGVDQVKVSFESCSNDYYFGLGDKTTGLNLNGHYFQNWNTDAFAFDKDKDPLYRSIPFYYGVKNELVFGLFFNNSYKSHFDFNSQKNGQTSIWADGGEMDYFFFHGENLNNIAEAYHYLTGTPELPPLWMLGFHQCRWSYYPESRVKELAASFRKHTIPCDAIYLDIDYMDDYRCFSWNGHYFPKPVQMIQELKEQGFHTVVMIDPGIKVADDYDVFLSGLEQGVYCRRANGELMMGPVWPSKCVWPDYTKEATRKWWGEQYQKLYLEDGVSGFWNDMNEPAVFKIDHGTFPDDVLHDNDGQPSNHKALHNIYGQQMSRATTDGLKELNPNKRPFVLARASFSGGQRHAAIWTGDNVANWEQLQLANRQCQRLSISGFSLVGTDIGGFVDQPEPELLIRWLQLGVFHPLFRIHSMGNNADGSAETDKEAVEQAENKNRFDREPWSFGEPYMTQARLAIEFRYRLLPYLYTSIYLHTQDGRPLIRSIAFEGLGDKKAMERENEFFFGQHLLISPVSEKGLKEQSTYLPSGKWLDYETGEVFSGKQIVVKEVNENSIPIYVKAGAIIPHYPVQQFTNELKIENVVLKVYFGKQITESQFYQDDGDGYTYKKGQFRLHQFTTSADKQSFTIKQKITGLPDDDLATFEIELYGLPFSPDELYIDEVQINIIDKKGAVVLVVVPADFKKMEIREL